MDPSDPDPAQQDREPGRGDALPFLSLGLFHHHPRIARLLLRDPRPRRAADRGAADVLPCAGLSPSRRPHPRGLRRRAARSRTATCSSPTIPTKAACRTSPTWRSSRRSLPMARSSRSPARSRTRPMSAARCRARPRPTPPRCTTRACCCRRSRSGTAGKPLPDIERIILANSRQPVLMRGDIHAQIAVDADGRRRASRSCAGGSAPRP